jgi:hypothetical protein
VTAQAGRGWAAIAGLAVVTAMLSVVRPALLIFVPLALLFIALPPRRPMLLALGAFIMWLTFSAEPGSTLWYFERGWALLLGAWFLMVVALLPEWRFLSRALLALGATVTTAAVVLVVNRNGFQELDLAVAGRLRMEANQLLATLANAPRVAEFVGAQADTALATTTNLFPALLALASLAGLGVAWWAFGRVARGEPRPLAPLREFRFSNELIWLLIAGVVLLLVPVNGLATRAGENLLMFMAALYALRGAGVLLMIAGVPGPVGIVVGTVLVLLLSKLVMAATILVGLSDTWLDLRSRRAAPTNPGS